jgi:hypothetical protein
MATSLRSRLFSSFDEFSEGVPQARARKATRNGRPRRRPPTRKAGTGYSLVSRKVRGPQRAACRFVLRFGPLSLPLPGPDRRSTGFLKGPGLPARLPEPLGLYRGFRLSR